MEDAAAIPTAEEVAAKKKKKARQGGTVLLFLVGAAFFATPLSIACFAVLSVMWWGRPLGMAALFGLALMLGLFGTQASQAAKPGAARPDALEKWIGKPDRAALSAAAGGASATAPSVAPAAPRIARSASAYKVIEVKDGGTIRGVVTMPGAPARWTIPHDNKDVDKGCKPDHPTEALVVGEGGALGNCFVSLRAISAGKDWPEPMRAEDRSALVDQKSCLYVPHVQWIRPQTQLAIKNSDRADHNIHGYLRDTGSTQFNFSSGPGSFKGDVESAMLEIPAPYLLKCDIHPWMSAYVHVNAHPYGDVTSAEATATRKAGEYVLEGVPPGAYYVVCWHEGMREQPLLADGKINAYVPGDAVELVSPQTTVDAGATVVVNFTVPAPPPR